MRIARLLIMLLALAILPVFVASAQVPDEVEAAVRANLAKRFPSIDLGSLTATPVDGLYEIRIGAQVAYISADGRFLVQGDIYDVESETNITEARRTQARAAAIDALGDSSMIIFSPAAAKHTVTVFTDIDCGYCRKLHRQIDGYNKAGIRVRYMFFPRSGPNTESWSKAEQVWCAKDRNAALTKAKAGQSLAASRCASTPVAQHYQLGQSFGIRGTPAIVMDDGELIPGYIPPEELLSYLED